MRHLAQSGFTLLESMVTLSILASTLIPLYMLFGTNISTLLRVADINEQTLVTQEILPMLSHLNPVEKPSGSKELSSFKFSWDAQPLTPESAIITQSPGSQPGQPPQNSKQEPSVQRVQLYKVTINVTTPEGKDWFSFSVRQLGWTPTPTEDTTQ